MKFSFLLTLLFSLGLRAMAADYFVSPDGNDNNSGTKKKPFASLEKAQRAVRELLATGQRQPVTVYLLKGRYHLDKTLVFGPQDGGRQGLTVTYTAYPGHSVILSAARTVSGWKPVDQMPEALPSKARGKVWYTDLAPGTDFKMLYDRGRALPRARSQGFMPLPNKQGSGNHSLLLPESVDPSAWASDEGLEVLIRPTYAWTMNILPVKTVDAAARRIVTSAGGTYPLDPQPQWSLDAHHITETCWLENSVAFLDQPGEWALDSRSGRLWLWPADGRMPENITFPVATELFSIHGKIKDDAPADEPVRGLIFRNLTFTNNDRYTWTDQDRGFQHDWSAVDQASAMIRFRGAEDCAVEGCILNEGGTTGIRLDLHCRNIRVEGNYITRMGEHGIALCGYGPGSKDVNNHNRILNNRIERVGRQYWYGSGIYIAQSGENTIAHNLIHELPFIGITISGCRDFNYGKARDGEGYESVRWRELTVAHREQISKAYAEGKELSELFYPYLHARNNRITHNEIFHVVEAMGDGNAIYLSGAGTGNTITNNFIHDIYSTGVQTALRPDDLQEQTSFSHNVVYKCVYGAVEHKHDNSYTNNIFANIFPVNRNGERWDEWAYVVFGRGPNRGTRLQHNIFYDGIGTDFRFYYHRKDSPLTDALIDNNLYFSSRSPESAQKQLHALQEAGLDRHSRMADPLFRNPELGDFSMPPDSPARELGFQPIDVQRMGLVKPWKSRLTAARITRTFIRSTVETGPEGVQVSITSDDPAAVIRFTTDGSAPDETSAIYSGPFRSARGGWIRARAFGGAGLDLYGCAAYFNGLR